MKTAGRLLFAASLGAGTYFGTHELLEHISVDDTVAAYSRSIENCAQNLGNKATTAASLPSDCVGIGETGFSYRTTTVDNYNGDNSDSDDDDLTKETTRTIYFLPPKSKFLHENLSTSDLRDQASEDEALNYWLPGAMGALAFTMAVTFTSRRFTRSSKSKSESETAPIEPR